MTARMDPRMARSRAAVITATLELRAVPTADSTWVCSTIVRSASKESAAGRSQ